jgi:uncharacterized protein (DUF433 family)
MVSANEAAVLAMLDPRDIHRAFDEGLLPAAVLRLDGEGRHLARAAVPLLAFYFRSVPHLTPAARRQVIDAVLGAGAAPLRRLAEYRRQPRPLPLGPGTTVSLAPFFTEIEAMTRRVAAARAMVHTDPGIGGGAEPVIRGTRVPVRDVAAALAAGTAPAAILAAYPGLKAAQLELAALYGKLEPARGRPPRRLSALLPPGTRPRASGRIAHRPPAPAE